jgi:hypothetical protein
MTPEEIEAHKNRGHMTAMHLEACEICTPPRPAALTSNQQSDPFTAAEHEVLRLLGAAFNAFGNLPKLHPADLPEFIHYTHALQNMVIQRPGARALYGVAKPVETAAPRLGMDTPWPLHEAVATLISGVEHLLRDHTCDAHGHENLKQAVTAGKKYLATLQSSAETPAERIHLPKITPELLEQFGGNCSLVHHTGGGLEWSQEAVDFACMLKEAAMRLPVKSVGKPG